MKKIKQDTPRVKVSIADLNDANRQSQRVVDMAKHYAKRAHDAEHDRDSAVEALDAMRRQRNIARVLGGVAGLVSLVLVAVLS